MPSEQLYDKNDSLTEFDEQDYQIEDYIGRGGTGEVYRLRSSLHGCARIVKIFIPFYYFEKIKRIGLFNDEPSPELSQQVFKAFDSLKISNQEYNTLAELNHPFVVPVHDLLLLKLPGKALERLHLQFGLPPEARSAYGIVATYVDGVPILDFAKTASADDLFETIHAVALALDHLNLAKSVLHCDIKSDNVLVRRSDGLPTVVDFGLAQQALPDKADDRRVSISTDLLPPFPLSSIASDLRRSILAGEDVSRAEFMKEFWPWLDRYQFGLLLSTVLDRSPNILTPERAFLSNISERLKDQEWLLAHSHEPIAPYVERANANRVYGVVRTGARESDLRIPSPSRRINIPEELRAIAQHPALVRLNRLNQLSLLPARFPGATHSRFLHCLDTYRLTRALARRMLDRPEFRSLMAESDVLHLLAAALLHDVNHLPMLHIIQELPEKSHLPDPFIAAINYQPWSIESLGSRLEAIGMTTEQLAALTRQRHQAQQILGRPLTDSEAFIGSVIDGGVDVDKLSYLQLDSIYSGLPLAAGLDVEALFDAAIVGSANGRPVLAFREESLGVVESVIRARVEGFERLYWCDENRAMMACVLAALRSLVASEGGLERLNTEVANSVGGSDFAFLQRLDTVTDELKVHHFPLASFFDGAWDRVVPIYRSNDASRYRRLKDLTAADRTQLDHVFGRGFRDKFGTSGETNLVLLDVPSRDLDLGGPIYVGERDRPATDVSMDGRFTPYRERLSGLSRRVSVYVDRDIYEKVPGDAEAKARHTEDLLEEALTKKSTNWA